MNKITIEDISRHTGLSRGTVSRALNDRPDISQQTKQRVLDACAQLKYVPSHAARSLATGRRYAVAVLVDDLRSMLAGAFVRGVVGRARVEHYAVHVSELGPEPGSALEHLRALITERVDSVLLATPLRADLAHRIVETLAERPIVASSPIEGVACDIFAPDHTEAGRLAARHIMRGGTGSVLYVHETGSEAAAQRRAGFYDVLGAAGVNPEHVTVEVAPREPSDADRLAAVRARLGDVRAIAAANDFLAIELMLVCCQAGRIPGRDIAIIGQGNELVGSRIWPSLTTIDFCGEEIGQRAMEIALQRVTKSRQDAPQHVLIPPMLVPRESTRLLQ